MIIEHSLPAILLACIGFLLLSGFVVLVWGRRLPRQGDWLVAFGLAVLFGGIAFNGNALVHGGGRGMVWLKGWIWPHDENGAITVGVLQDSVGLVMAGLATLVSAILVADAGMRGRVERVERFFAAFAFGTAGATLAWVSATPWIAFVGLIISVFGGFICLGALWTNDSEAKLAIRFGWERAWGVGLAVFGACGLAVSRGPLNWAEDTMWFLGGHGGGGIADTIGVVLLIAGLYIQFQPFPFIGWTVTDSEVPSPARILLTQVVPAWTAFAILFRLEPRLEASGILPAFGWLLLISSVLAVLSGLLQQTWRSAIGAWMSAGLSLSAAMLAFSEQRSALAMLIGISVGGLILSAAGTWLEEGEKPQEGGEGRVTVLRVISFLGVSAATGVVGFISSGGGIRWIMQAIGHPALAALSILGLFLFFLLGWKLAFTSSRLEGGMEVPLYSVISPFLLLILTLGLVWTGSVTGVGGFNGFDQVAPSLFDNFFGVLKEGSIEQADLTTSIFVYVGALFFGVAGAFWLSRRPPSELDEANPSAQKFFAFIRGGYGVDEAAARAMLGLTWVGGSVQKFVDQDIWGRWMPSGIVISVRRSAAFVADLDVQMSARSREFFRHGVDVPAKLLQLIQSGDVQWYIFFAVGSGIALLIHFLRV